MHGPLQVHNKMETATMFKVNHPWAKITRMKLKVNKTKTKIVIAVKTNFWFITIRKYFDTISKCFPSVLETNALYFTTLIRSAIETRKIRIHSVLFLEPKVRQRKLKCAKILSRTPGKTTPRAKWYVFRYCETHAFTSGISSKLSCLLLSPPRNVPKFVSKHYSFSLSKK